MELQPQLKPAPLLPISYLRVFCCVRINILTKKPISITERSFFCNWGQLKLINVMPQVHSDADWIFWSQSCDWLYKGWLPFLTNMRYLIGETNRFCYALKINCCGSNCCHEHTVKSTLDVSPSKHRANQIMTALTNLPFYSELLVSVYSHCIFEYTALAVICTTCPYHLVPLLSSTHSCLRIGRSSSWLFQCIIVLLNWYLFAKTTCTLVPLKGGLIHIFILPKIIGRPTFSNFIWRKFYPPSPIWRNLRAESTETYSVTFITALWHRLLIYILDRTKVCAAVLFHSSHNFISHWEHFRSWASSPPDVDLLKLCKFHRFSLTFVLLLWLSRLHT